MKPIQSLLLAAALCVTTAASAQFAIDFGGGLSHATTAFDGAPEDVRIGWHTGYFFGVAPTYQVNERISLSANLQYTLRGFNFNDDSAISNATTFKLSYIDFMPEAEYRFHQRFGLSVGGYVGYKFLERIDQNGDRNIDPIADFTNSTDFGLTTSARVYHRAFYASLRYNHGLANISGVEFTDINSEPLGRVDQKTRNFQLGVGYTLSFPKKLTPTEG